MLSGGASAEYKTSRAGYFQPAPLPNLKFRNEMLIASKNETSIFGRRCGRILDFGIILMLVASKKVQKLAAGAAEFCTLNIGIK